MRRRLWLSIGAVALAAASAASVDASRTQPPSPEATVVRRSFSEGGGSAPQNQAPSPADLQGAWKLVSLTFDGQPQKATGYMIFQGAHYSFITNRERPRLPAGVGNKPPAQLNPEEVRAYVEAFRNMTAAAGPFSVKGEEVVYVMEVVRTPNLAGQTEERKSWLENGRLIQDFIGGGRRQVYVWERVSRGTN